MMNRGVFMVAVAWLAASPGQAQVRGGRFHVEMEATSRETRVALVGMSHTIEGALARCAPHTHGQASGTRVTLRFTPSGHLRAISSAAIEGEGAPADALRTCIESAVHAQAIPAIHDDELVMLVRYAPAAQAPDAGPGEAASVVGYSTEALRRVVHDHASEVSHCYDTTRVDHHDAQGALTMRFTIGVDGRATGAVADRDELRVTSLTTCIATALQRWPFPAPPGGDAVEVTYPFVFSRTD
jgi:hypothetical protein